MSENETVPQRMSPEAAQAALSSVAQGQALGRRRGVWPRWANGVESVYLGVVVALAGYAHLTVPMLLLAAAGIGFRFWCIRRFGAYPRLGWIDVLLIGSVFGVVLAVAPMRFSDTVGWLPVIIGAGFSLWLLFLYELRRRLLLSAAR